MASKRSPKIESPGNPEPDAPAPAAEADAPPEIAEGDKLTPKQERQLAANVAEAKQLVGAEGALDWSHLTHGLAPAKGSADDGLPLTADPAKISKPTLTKSGWVMPLNDPRAQQ